MKHGGKKSKQYNIQHPSIESIFETLERKNSKEKNPINYKKAG